MTAQTADARTAAQSNTTGTPAQATPAAPDQAHPALGAALLTALDGPFHDARAQVRAQLTPADLLADPALSLEEARTWTHHALVDLVAKGYGLAGFPRAQGGGGDLVQSVIEFEAMAHGDLSLTIKSGVQHGLFGGAITNLGTAWHHEQFLPDVMTLRLLGCFAMTELGHGSDVQSLETTISYDRVTDEYVVDSPTPTATKAYIGGAGRYARMAVVFGQLIVAGQRHGIHAVLVPIRDADGVDLPGVTTGDQGAKGGLPGVDNGTIRFDQVRVVRRMLLNRYGGVGEDGRYSSVIEDPNRRFFTMVGTLVRGRICIGGAAGVAARRGLSIATRHALRRRQFPAPGRSSEVLLLDYLTHQRKLFPAIARAYALAFAQNELIGTLARVMGTPGMEAPEADVHAQRELETRTAGLKAMTTRFANDTLQMCREACGGAGYLAENRLTQLRADTDVFATFEGDNTVLMQLVAKALLTHYKATWGDLNIIHTVQATARLTGEAVIERTAARPAIDRLLAAAQRRSPEDRLLHRGWHVWMFEERERHVLETLAQRLRARARSADRNDPATSFAAQAHLIYAAQVHIERVMLEAFIAGIEACGDPAATQVLNRLCTLFVLSSLEADRGWYLEHNRMSPAQAKAITHQIDVLCGQLRPDALGVVEGLGVPAQWLGSAMLSE